MIVVVVVVVAVFRHRLDNIETLWCRTEWKCHFLTTNPMVDAIIVCIFFLFVRCVFPFILLGLTGFLYVYVCKYVCECLLIHSQLAQVCFRFVSFSLFFCCHFHSFSHIFDSVFMHSRLLFFFFFGSIVSHSVYYFVHYMTLLLFMSLFILTFDR